MKKLFLFLILFSFGFILNNAFSYEHVHGFRFEPRPPPPPPDVLKRIPKDLNRAGRKYSVPTSQIGENHFYSDSKTLVLIYSTYRKYASDPFPTDYLTEDEIDILREEVLKSRDFVWRHSHAKFNMQITDLAVVSRELYLDQFWETSNGAFWLPFWSVDGEHSVDQDIIDLGFVDKVYDCVIVLYAWENTANANAAYGGAMYGVGYSWGSLNGAAYIAIPLEWGIKEKRGVIVHEYLHFIDSVFEAAGEPDFPHADLPQSYSGDYNFLWEWHAWILQSWPLNKWMNTGIYTIPMSALDADSDGLPDLGTDGSGTSLAVTELSFGSSTNLIDTDKDELSDIDEIKSDIFESSNPLDIDTDNDNIIDGEDPYPVFPVKTDRIPGNPFIDGWISEEEHIPLGEVSDPTESDLKAKSFFEWDNEYLYVSASVQDDDVDGSSYNPWLSDCLHISIDVKNDGFRWHGNDNLEIWIGPIGVNNQPFLFSRIINADGPIDSTVTADVDFIYEVRLAKTGYIIELGIPAIPEIGLLPKEGSYFGFNACIVDFDNLDGSQPPPEYDLITSKLYPEIAFVDLNLTTSMAFIWTGEVNSDWEEPDNWDVGAVPGDGANVLIPVDCPPAIHSNISGSSNIDQLTCSGQLTISGGSLTID